MGLQRVEHDWANIQLLYILANCLIALSTCSNSKFKHNYKLEVLRITSVQFSSVAQLCPTLRDPMNRSMLGLPIHYQLLEFTQTHAH